MFKYQKFLFNRTKTNMTTEDSRAAILNDAFLKYVYVSHLQNQLRVVSSEVEQVEQEKFIEIGAAGGITKFLQPAIITCDVRDDEDVDIIISSEILPFENESISGAVAKDVFHHIPNIEKHLHEMRRVLKDGGKCAYIEPNWNLFSRIFYTLIHPEPWEPKQVNWSFDSDDPMFSNQALPWMVFVRDRAIFEEKFPDLRVHIQEVPLVGLSYLISGGLNRRNRISSKFLINLYIVEQKSALYLKLFGLGRLIVITKKKN
jgi:SAM-dependent methyltransferase